MESNESQTVLWVLRRPGPPVYELELRVSQVVVGMEPFPEPAVLTLMVGHMNSDDGRQLVQLDRRVLPDATEALRRSEEMRTRYLDAGWQDVDSEHG